MGLVSNCHQRSNDLSRVETAYLEKEAFVDHLLIEKNLLSEELNLFFRAFKKEQELEVWGKNTKDKIYKKIITYPFCSFSGQIGPKRKEGDRQIPEGVYIIDRFNPRSQFYLSLGLNYPNKSDKIRGDRQKPGSDIFIHGGCQTIGCIPITDDKIKELYVLASKSRDNGQKEISIHIFPGKMTESLLLDITKEKPEHTSFWKELKAIYDHFEMKKEVPGIEILESGTYQIKNELGN